jgi:hypothetical protein
MDRPSVLSCALKVTVSAVSSLTVNWADPSDPVSWELGVTCAVEDDVVSVTVLPATALVPSAANKVTVTVPVGNRPLGEVCVETIEVLAVTVDVVAETTSVPKVTEALWPVSAIPSVVSVAVYVTVSGVESVTVNVASP